LRLIVITGAVLAVSYHNQCASPAIIVSSLAVLSHMFSSEVNAVDHCGLTTFDIKIVNGVQQCGFIAGKFLKVFDLLAIDEAFEKSFVAFLIAVDDRFGGVDYLRQL